MEENKDCYRNKGHNWIKDPIGMKVCVWCGETSKSKIEDNEELGKYA